MVYHLFWNFIERRIIIGMRIKNNSNHEEKRNKLCNIWRHRSHRNKLIFAKTLCIAVAICVIALTFVYMQTINEINNSMHDTISILKEERFNQIYLYAMELRKMASDQAEEVAVSIEQDIKSNIDMEQLKIDLDSNQTNEDLHMVFRKNIANVGFNGIGNQRDGIFITSMDGILEDMNHYRASSSVTDKRDWEYEIGHAYNSYLEKEAVRKLTNHSKEIIITEHVNRLTQDDSNYESHKLINSASYDTLKSVYMEEGINGLKNYQFLNPAYILDTEDIFGQPQIIEGLKQETHTFIVVQEFNLYDQIKTHYPKLMDDSFIKSVELYYHNVLNILYIVGIFYGVILVVLLAFVSNKYNRYFDKHDLGNIPPKNNHNMKINE